MLDTGSMRENLRTYPDVIEALDELESTEDMLAQAIAVGRDWRQIATDLRRDLAKIVGSNVGTWESAKAFDEKAKS